MSNFKILKNLPVLDLYSEFQRLLSENTIDWYKFNKNYIKDQICINSTVDNDKDIYYGRGSLIFDWDNHYYTDNGTMIVPKRKTILKESDFTVLCTQFKGTLFEEVYNELSSQYNVGRIRIMNSKPKTCLTWHKDDTTRIHYPIKTHEGCFMVIGDEVCHLNETIWYHTNTLTEHTAFNASKEDRLHLVVNILAD